MNTSPPAHRQLRQTLRERSRARPGRATAPWPGAGPLPLGPTSGEQPARPPAPRTPAARPPARPRTPTAERAAPGRLTLRQLHGARAAQRARQTVELLHRSLHPRRGLREAPAAPAASAEPRALHPDPGRARGRRSELAAAGAPER